jgi:UDP-N-acetylglucosamine acyltransferase
MTQIHATALVDSRAELGQNVIIGPFCQVETGVVIGDDCRLEAGVVIRSGTSLGCDNQIGEGAILGGRAQQPEDHEVGGTVWVGDHNRIRENVTIHRAWAKNAATVVKDSNLLMVSSHVGHDCKVGNRCILVNHVLLGAFAEVSDGAYLGGGSIVAERCRIGRLAMLGAMTLVEQDVPPFMTVVDSQVVGLNRVGLGRNGFTPEEMTQVKAAYRVIYRRGLPWSEVLAMLQADFRAGPASEFHDFLSQDQRGFVQERQVPRKAELKFIEAASGGPS